MTGPRQGDTAGGAALETVDGLNFSPDQDAAGRGPVGLSEIAEIAAFSPFGLRRCHRSDFQPDLIVHAHSPVLDAIWRADCRGKGHAGSRSCTKSARFGRMLPWATAQEPRAALRYRADSRLDGNLGRRAAPMLWPSFARGLRGDSDRARHCDPDKIDGRAQWRRSYSLFGDPPVPRDDRALAASNSVWTDAEVIGYHWQLLRL